LAFLASCGGSDFVKINDKFALWATDDRAGMSLCFLDFEKYYVGIVGPCVFAAGADDDFIILKEHPVMENEDVATVFCYGTATHYLPNDSGQNLWTVVGTYDFHLTRQGANWKVDAMTFHFKYQDGNLGLPDLARERLLRSQTNDHA
jgi:hypothetical protein